MPKTIQYGINTDGLVWSRVGSEIALPVLEYDKIKGQEPFQYHLEKFPILSLCRELHFIKWTRKIPTKLKNKHRKFWDFIPLKLKD